MDHLDDVLGHGGEAHEAPPAEVGVEQSPGAEAAGDALALPPAAPSRGERGDDPSVADVVRVSRGTVVLLRIGRVPLRLHFSVLVALPFFAWLAEARMRAPVTLASLGGQPYATPWTWALVLTAGLVVAVLLHEAAHLAAARVAGGRVGSMTLLLLGGCAHVSGLPRRSELAVLAAGPMLSLAGGIACHVAALRLPIRHIDVRYALVMLAQVQLVLGAIDLIPSPPLDGGRILVALLGRRIGRMRATVHAARLGKTLAVALAAAGTLVANALLIALAGVVWAGAERSTRRASQAESLRGLTVRSALGLAPEAPPAIDGGASVTALASRMRREQRLHFAVTDGSVLSGVVSAVDVARVPSEDRTCTQVRELSRPAPSVDVGTSALEAASLMRALGVPVLPVTERGVLVALLGETALVALEQLGALEA